jgi:hypothetical protein
VILKALTCEYFGWDEHVQQGLHKLVDDKWWSFGGQFTGNTTERSLFVSDWESLPVVLRSDFEEKIQREDIVYP